MHNLRKFNKIYPLMIEKYEQFIPNSSGNSVPEKINSIVNELNRIGKLTNDVVKDWNQVMEWVMNDGLSEEVQLKIDSLFESGVFDEMVQLMVDQKSVEVDERLDGFSAELASTSQKVDSKIEGNNQPQLLDLHYEILKGVGWVEDLNPSTTSYISVSAESGAKSLTVVDGTPYKQGQLIVIRDFNNDYYSINKITTIAGNVLNLEFPLERSFGSGNRVYKFYINYAHPTTEGYNAIADYIVTKTLGSGSELLYNLPSNMFTTSAGSTISGGIYTDYKTPDESFSSFSLIQYEKFQVNVNLEGGLYDFDIIANLKNAANIRFEIVRNSDNSQVFGQRLVSSDTLATQKVRVNLSSGNYKLYLANVDVATANILFKNISIFKITNANTIRKLDRKKHVFLGDSWFADGTFINRVKKYLPNAELLNYGVGGNKMDNLLRRFNGTATTADKTSTMSDELWNLRKDVSVVSDIDYVWVMCGTNDYFANKTAQTFHQELSNLIGDITKRGAKPVVFNSSVGDMGKGAGTVSHDILKLSRQYVSYNFLTYPFFNPKIEEVFTITIPISHEVPQGAKTISSIYINSMIVEIEQVTFNNGTGKSIDIGFGDINIQNSNLANVVNFTQNISQKVPIVTKDVRFLNIVLNNDNATTVNFTGVVMLKLKPVNY